MELLAAAISTAILVLVFFVLFPDARVARTKLALRNFQDERLEKFQLGTASSADRDLFRIIKGVSTYHIYNLRPYSFLQYILSTALIVGKYPNYNPNKLAFRVRALSMQSDPTLVSIKKEFEQIMFDHMRADSILFRLLSYYRKLRHYQHSTNEEEKETLYPRDVLIPTLA